MELLHPKALPQPPLRRPLRSQRISVHLHHLPRNSDLTFGRIGHNRLVIKAQVLAGGRGKGKFDNGYQGGVHMVETYDLIRRLSCRALALIPPVVPQKLKKLRGRCLVPS